jgi:glycosyltransferase involved in cell wall biosynthesis
MGKNRSKNEVVNTTVIVPTYNGAHRLQALIDSLILQTNKKFELIFVIDGSTDHTIEVLSKYRQEFAHFKILEQENKGRAGARNTGAEHAQGEYLIFFDDDMRPDENSVQRHLDLLSSGDEVISAGQQIEIESDTNEFIQYKGYLTRKWVRHFENRPTLLTKDTLFLIAANMGICKSTFSKLNGFDPLLRDSEDYDLAVRAFLKGVHTVFDPLNLAYHHSFESAKEYIRRRREYTEGLRNLYLLRNETDRSGMYRRYDVKKKPMHRYFYAMIPSRAAHWIDKKYFTFLPKSLRYKIYDRIISALTVYHPEKKINAQ